MDGRVYKDYQGLRLVFDQSGRPFTGVCDVAECYSDSAFTHGDFAFCPHHQLMVLRMVAPPLPPTPTSPSDAERQARFAAPESTAIEDLLKTDIRHRCLAVSDFLNNRLLASREAALAQTKLEEVMFWALASIERNA